MLDPTSFSKLCSSLNFDLKENFSLEGYQKSLSDIQIAVARAFEFDSPKALKDNLKKSKIAISPEVCDRFCEIVKNDFGFDYRRTPFTFKWPDCIHFSSDEIASFWRHSLEGLNLRIGADIYKNLTPVMQYKKGRWIITSESPFTVDQINSVIGKGIVSLDNTHTDINNKLNESAQEGDITALINIAHQHLMRQDNASAFKVLNQAQLFDNRNSEVLSCLALIYYEGAKGCVEVDLNLSESLYRQASDLGSAQSAFVLGQSYDLNGAFQQNFEQAFSYFKLAVERGHHYSIHRLIDMILCKRGVPKDLKPEYLGSLFSMGLKLDDPYTIARMATYYESNSLKEDDLIFELRDLCANNDTIIESANMNLANHYLKGRGCTKDIQLAIKYYEIEAKKFRCADSMYALSCIYREEFNDEKSYHNWLNKAFNAIDDKTIHAFQIILELGAYAYHEKNFDLSLSIFSKASDYRSSLDFNDLGIDEEVDNAKSKIRLLFGCINYDYLNLSKGFNEIYELAIKGFTPAKLKLANILLEDDGDLINGEMWLRMAKEDGCEVSARQYEYLFSSLSNSN